MAAIPMFNLPVLSTQYEKIQPIPTSNWMTALGQGLETVGEVGKNVADAKRIQEMNKKKKELEAMLNSAKNDDAKLEELQKKLDDLKAELMLAEKNEASIDAANQMQGYTPNDQAASNNASNQMQGYNPEQLYNSRSPDESRMQMMEAFGGMSRYPGQAPEETYTPINTFGFTSMALPQLRG